MRLQMILFVAALVTFGGVVSQLRANESTTHRITSGTFGVAWIAGEGLIYTYSPAGNAAPFRVNHVRAHQVAAIDYDGDGKDELAIVDALKKSLFVYDFDEKQMIGGFGHNVSEITVGRFHPDEEFESLIAATYSGQVYRWSKNVGDKGWIKLPGDFEKAYRGKVISRIKTEAAVTVSRGDVYTLNPIWSTYGQVLLGKDARLAIPCDLSAFPGEEIVVSCGDSHDLYLCRRKAATTLGIQANVMTRGKLATDNMTIVVVTPSGSIAKYNPEEKAWRSYPSAQKWCDVIVHDMDSDGQDELFAVSARAPEELFEYDASAELFKKLPHRLLDVTGKTSTVQLPTSATDVLGGDCENIRLGHGNQGVCDCKFWNSTHKPYIIRMYTPNGRNVLRDSPADHIHHHGLMFALTANDCDFWAEFPNQPQGKEVLSKLSVRVAEGDSIGAGCIAELKWTNADGLVLMDEERTITPIANGTTTLLDWSSEMSKSTEGKVVLAGSHYFGLGMRFVESMDNGGTFRFSKDHGESTLVRGDERVTKASWAAYTAKVDGGEPATAVIFSHPDNFRPMYAFTMGDDSEAFAFLSATFNLYREPYAWEGNDRLKMRWGIALFDGNPSNEEIDGVYAIWKSKGK